MLSRLCAVEQFRIRHTMTHFRSNSTLIFNRCYRYRDESNLWPQVQLKRDNSILLMFCILFSVLEKSVCVRKLCTN
jgi:hypothetical protein